MNKYALVLCALSTVVRPMEFKTFSDSEMREARAYFEELFLNPTPEQRGALEKAKRDMAQKFLASLARKERKKSCGHCGQKKGLGGCVYCLP